jgi:hypothetical protein
MPGFLSPQAGLLHQELWHYRQPLGARPPISSRLAFLLLLLVILVVANLSGTLDEVAIGILVTPSPASASKEVLRECPAVKLGSASSMAGEVSNSSVSHGQIISDAGVEVKDLTDSDLHDTINGRHRRGRHTAYIIY